MVVTIAHAHTEQCDILSRSMQLSRLRITLPNLLHVCLFLTAASISFLSFNKTLFSWHPFTMSLAYIFFMAEGLITAVQFRSLDGQERVNGIQSHAMMQLRAVILVLIGAGVIIYNKVSLIHRI